MKAMNDANEAVSALAKRGPAQEGLLNAVSFRQLMRAPASSVVVVATGREEQRSGCTVTAICSLSDEPPSLLVCLNKRSVALASILSHGTFSANYLSAEQSALADIFAGRTGVRGAARFGADWACGAHGTPILTQAMAWLECDLVGHHEFGSHDILVGRVLDGHSTDADPLLYSAGSYRLLQKH